MMRRSRVAAGLSAVALSASVLTLAPAAWADPLTPQTIAFACQMPDFGDDADFTYDASITFSSTGETDLQAELSDLPGVVPGFISIPDAAVSATLTVSVDDEEVPLTASGTTAVNPGGNPQNKEPVPLPNPFVGSPTAMTAESEVKVKTFAFTVAGVSGSCAAPGEVAPSPSPTPTPTPSPTPTESPEPTEKPGDKDGTPAKGQVTFACVLYPAFGADNARFDYKADVTVAGARATAEDTKVNLRATFSDIPGIAPVPIVDGGMTIEVEGSVAGEAMTLTGSSTVNAASKEEVPVPTLTASVNTDAEEAEVVLDSFKFDFGEMAGLHVYSECEAANGTVGTMTIGVGELGDEDPSDGPAPTNAPADPGATLPRTGGGDAMPVIGLWALALGLVGAGALVWLPRRRAEHL